MKNEIGYFVKKRCLSPLLLLGVMLMGFNVYSEKTLTVHYNRLNADYENWSLWVWNEEEKREGFDILPHGKDDFGLIFEINLDKNNISGKLAGFLPKYKNWEKKTGRRDF
jgi:hypothetical protein